MMKNAFDRGINSIHMNKSLWIFQMTNTKANLS